MQAETREKLEAVLGGGIKHIKPVSGGDIAAAYLIETATERLFCKLMQGLNALEMLSAEKEGLDRIRNTGAIKTPGVYFCEDLGDRVCLGMEFVESKNPSAGEMQKLGEQLAALHKTSSDKFGLNADNFIGSLPQSNSQHSSWVLFYVHERLKPQFQLALSRGLLHARDITDAESTIETLSPILNGVTPSLLHGDLWGGNYLVSSSGEPYLIDPAVYYGDPVVDLAMTRLFGGFSAGFYEGYRANTVALENEADKTQLYQLYYLLVHLNLFGSSYYGSVKNILKQYF